MHKQDAMLNETKLAKTITLDTSHKSVYTYTFTTYTLNPSSDNPSYYFGEKYVDISINM